MAPRGKKKLDFEHMYILVWLCESLQMPSILKILNSEEDAVRLEAERLYPVISSLRM